MNSRLNLPTPTILCCKRYELTMIELEREFLRALIEFETVNMENFSRRISLLDRASELARRNIEWIAENLTV